MRSEYADKMITDLSARKIPRVETVSGVMISITSNSVYPPKGTVSEAVASAIPKILKRYTNPRVLDYGCGTGFLGIVSAKYGAKVTALDLSPDAIEHTSTNMVLNGVDFDVRYSDGFSALLGTEKFDLILAVLPFEEAKPNTQLEVAFYDENSVAKNTLFANAKKHLTKEGTILFVYSDRMQKILPMETFVKGFNFKKIVSSTVMGDNYFVVQLTPKTFY